MSKFTKYLIFASALIGVFVSASVLAGTTVIETNVSSSANTGGNSVSEGGTPDDFVGAGVRTGNASASASVKTETNDDIGTTTVKATASANGEKKEIVEVFTGDGEISIHADVQASSTGVNYESGIMNYGDNEEILEKEVTDKNKVEIKNVTISRIAPEEEIGKRILASFLSALKNTFAYVVSFFKF